MILIDLDLDGWLDIVTATTPGEDVEPKPIGHPREGRASGSTSSSASKIFDR